MVLSKFEKIVMQNDQVHPTTHLNMDYNGSLSPMKNVISLSYRNNTDGYTRKGDFLTIPDLRTIDHFYIEKWDIKVSQWYLERKIKNEFGVKELISKKIEETSITRILREINNNNNNNNNDNLLS